MEHEPNKVTPSLPTEFYRDMFNALIQEAAVSMYMLENGKFTYVNNHFSEMIGYSEEEMLDEGVPVDRLIHPEDLPVVLKSIAQKVDGKKTRYRVRAIHKNGNLHHVEIHATKKVIMGKYTIFGTVIDVTEEVKAQQLLEEKKEQFQSLFYHNPDAVFAFDLEGRFIDANQACVDLTGYLLEDLLDMSFAPLIISEHLSKTLTYFEEAIKGKVNRYEITINRKDGKQVYLDLTNFPMKRDGEIIGAYGIAKDITEQVEYRQKMEELAFYDPLTGLPNRKLFEDRLEQVNGRLKESNDCPAVLFLDLNRFKFINDTLGHQLGDEFLKIVAHRLTQSVRKTDTVARISGDEFAILLPDTTEREAIRLAERLNKELANPYEVEGHSVSISASIGIALSENNMKNDVPHLIKNADIAMYHTKKYGDQPYTIYSEELDLQTRYKLTIEKDLKNALRNQEFMLHYQPIVDLESGDITAMEALIRWNHPTLGLVPPDNFIPVSEESGQIIPIGNWVLETACRQNKQWQEAGHGPFKICVNISTIQLQREDFVETLRCILKKTGLDPQWLELEVTEGILMEDTVFLKESLLKLKSLGVSVAIDDFGTGYTSLSYLRQFSFDRVKIDRSFIKDIHTDVNGKAITSTIIALAHRLNIGVIAEGIEDEQQLSFLQGETCDEGQGYYFSRPMAPDKHDFPLLNKK
ncbi:EAL domain-containing protein [Planococcus salinus]|uniref:EAL domain-containing protein n=1 Tax=Planococcus salinus TaxID=1848460 RepID=A0A3M8PBV6_9BACL|nr:EAL domain-containing protein [Planococcus salinus]RNF41189.1 EAL domain-containing protein [Planococcus salinus]